ncbi:MAG: ribonuclease PH [Spirochaetes bacterium]|nr:ribonuclease PH [Spirochaetota bacterium]
MAIRKDRKNDEIREVKFTKNIMENAYASILIQSGKTKILCTASVDAKTPVFIDENKMGWVTAEYNMLPGATLNRKSRSTYKPDSRSIEIQRIIGRALRAAIDLKKIKGFSIIIDCDVIQADGGTRTSAITGGYVVLEMAIKKMMCEHLIDKYPLINKIASISAGMVGKKILLDLNYNEDSNAEVDFNVVMNEKGNFIEVQGTGEKGDISKENLLKILEYCEIGIKCLFKKQDEILKSAG